MPILSSSNIGFSDLKQDPLMCCTPDSWKKFIPLKLSVNSSKYYGYQEQLIFIYEKRKKKTFLIKIYEDNKNRYSFNLFGIA